MKTAKELRESLEANHPGVEFTLNLLEKEINKSILQNRDGISVPLLQPYSIDAFDSSAGVYLYHQEVTKHLIKLGYEVEDYVDSWGRRNIYISW